MKRIDCCSKLEENKYYWCKIIEPFPTDDDTFIYKYKIDHIRFDDKVPIGYIDNGYKMWCYPGNAQAFARYEIYGPIMEPDEFKEL